MREFVERVHSHQLPVVDESGLRVTIGLWDGLVKLQHQLDKIEGVGASKLARAEFWRLYERWIEELRYRFLAVWLRSQVELLEAVEVSTMKKIASRDHRPQLTTQQLADERRSLRPTIEGLKRVETAPSTILQRRGGNVLMASWPADEAIAAFYGEIERLVPLWKGLLRERRKDPFTWKLAVERLAKESRLPVEKQDELKQIIRRVELGKSMNGAPVEPRTCAREHARVLLGISKRADSKLREIEKISKQVSSAR